MVRFAISYHKLENQEAVKIVLCNCNLNFSGGGLETVDITTPEPTVKMLDTLQNSQV